MDSAAEARTVELGPKQKRAGPFRRSAQLFDRGDLADLTRRVKQKSSGKQKSEPRPARPAARRAARTKPRAIARSFLLNFGLEPTCRRSYQRPREFGSM
jgi:hypothetical protein